MFGLKIGSSTCVRALPHGVSSSPLRWWSWGVLVIQTNIANWGVENERSPIEVKNVKPLWYSSSDWMVKWMKSHRKSDNWKQYRKGLKGYKNNLKWRRPTRENWRHCACVGNFNDIVVIRTSDGFLRPTRNWGWTEAQGSDVRIISSVCVETCRYSN